MHETKTANNNCIEASLSIIPKAGKQRMMKASVLILFFATLTACVSPNPGQSLPNIEVGFLSPAYDGYLVRIQDKTLTVSIRQIGIKNGRIFEEDWQESASKNLFTSEIDSISVYAGQLKKLDPADFNDESLTFTDAWQYSIRIGDSEPIEVYVPFLSLSGPEGSIDIERLIAYIIKISPVEIVLRGFA